MAGSLAVYPMVEEHRARGRVAAVYRAALEQTPFVPSLLKSLAVCPPYLVLAWEQIAPILDGDELEEAAADLVASVRTAARPPAEPDDRKALAAFETPLSRMSLLAAGLAAALDGALAHVPAAGGDPPLPPPMPVPPGPPDAAELNADAMFGRIRAALDTPIVNSIWCKLATDGRLARVWAQLEPQAAATRERAEALESETIAYAHRLPWRSAADAAALRAAGIDDAEPGIAAVLDAYLKTLPRVLTLVASSAHPSPP